MAVATPTRLRRRSKAPTADIRVSALGTPIKRADTSRQFDDDGVFRIDNIADAKLQILPTPYDLQSIARIVERSNIVRQCIEAYIVNIASYGFRVVQADEEVKVNETERKELKSIIGWANPDESLTSVFKKHVRDYEHYGFGYYEVIRNKGGRITLVRPVKSATMRLLRKTGKTVTVKREIPRGGKRATITEKKRFRKFVQLKPGTHERVYFKEFGDPRKMDFKTGLFAGEADQESVSAAREATEVIHSKQISDDSYGTPRWISQLPGILGSREAEEVNLRFFEDNTIPPMMLLVSGGRLTRKSFEELQRILTDVGLGKERQHQILLVEAVAETAGLDEKGHVALDVERLTNTRQSDGLFAEYDDANMAKITSSFRLPNVLIGKSQDITFATANVSAFVAEMQVFLPERQHHAEILNKSLVNSSAGLGFKTVKLEARGPQITNPEQIIKSLTAANVMGAVTPRKAVEAINDTIEISLEQYPEPGAEDYQEWMDMPIALALKSIRSNNTQDEQRTKTPGIKETESEGATGPTNPENGQE